MVSTALTGDDWGSPEFEAFTGKLAWIMDTPEYKEVSDYLYNVVNNASIDTLSAIYIIAYDSSRSEPYSLYITVATEEPVCYPGVIDRFESFEVFDAVYDPDGGFEPYTGYYDEYGWLVVAGAPIYDGSGDYTAFMCVDLLMGEVKAHEYAFIINLTVMLVIVTFVLGAIYLVIIIRSIVDPINRLLLVASDYINNSEKKVSFHSINISRSDEIGELTEAMKKMESDIGSYIDDITKMTAEKERIGAELGVATRIQADMLPIHFPKREDFSIYAVMTPAKEVGGDFYDFFMIDESHVGLVMADVSGKGVPAALFMVITKTLIKNRALMGGTPAEILADVHDHCPPLATTEGLTFEDERISLSKGDRLFLYTDGVTEAKGKDGERYGTDRMIGTLNSIPASDPRDLLMKMKADIDKFNGDADPFDDITMLGLYIN